jgi:hypothetical protein
MSKRTRRPDPEGAAPQSAVPWNESRWPYGGGSKVTQPEYHSTGVPPSSPERGQPPGISTVQHDLPDPADRPAVFTDHQAIMEEAMVHGMTHEPLRRDLH